MVVVHKLIIMKVMNFLRNKNNEGFDFSESGNY